MQTQDGIAVVVCVLCKQPNHVPVTREQVRELSLPRSERRLMQDIFPDLSIGDRELLISGTCDTCWQNLYGSEDEEE
jgi:hypothetical protein